MKRIEVAYRVSVVTLLAVCAMSLSAMAYMVYQAYEPSKYSARLRVSSDHEVRTVQAHVTNWPLQHAGSGAPLRVHVTNEPNVNARVWNNGVNDQPLRVRIEGR